MHNENDLTIVVGSNWGPFEKICMNLREMKAQRDQRRQHMRDLCILVTRPMDGATWVHGCTNVHPFFFARRFFSGNKMVDYLCSIFHMYASNKLKIRLVKL